MKRRRSWRACTRNSTGWASRGRFGIRSRVPSRHTLLCERLESPGPFAEERLMTSLRQRMLEDMQVRVRDERATAIRTPREPDPRRPPRTSSRTAGRSAVRTGAAPTGPGVDAQAPARTPRSTHPGGGRRSGRGGRRCRALAAASAGTPPGDDLRDGAGCAPGRVALVDGAETQLDLASAAVDLTVW